MIAEKMESALKALKKLKAEQTNENYHQLKAIIQVLAGTVDMVRRMENTPLRGRE